MICVEITDRKISGQDRWRARVKLKVGGTSCHHLGITWHHWTPGWPKIRKRCGVTKLHGWRAGIKVKAEFEDVWCLIRGRATKVGRVGIEEQVTGPPLSRFWPTVVLSCIAVSVFIIPVHSNIKVTILQWDHTSPAPNQCPIMCSIVPYTPIWHQSQCDPT